MAATQRYRRVSELLAKPNHAVLSTLNSDGSIHSAIVWLNVEDDKLALNSASGRAWPTNLERDRAAPRCCCSTRTTRTSTSRSRAPRSSTDEGADEHIDTLAQKYINQDKYPWRTPEEQRVKFRVTPTRVRHAKAG